MHKLGGFLAGFLLVLLAALLMAPSGGFPSRPTFQKVTATLVRTAAESAFVASSAGPFYRIFETDAATNEKNWELGAAGGNFLCRIMTDSGGTTTPWCEMTRTGTTLNTLTLGGDGGVANVQTVDLRASTSVLANGVGIDSSLFVRKTATTSRASTTTATDDPHLTVTLASGVVYQVEAYLLVDSTSATPDFKFQFTRPTNTNSFVTYDTIEQAVGVVVASANSGTYGSIFTVPLTVNSDHTVKLSGLIETTASGTFAVSWAQNTSDAAATNLLAGSWLRLTRVN